MNYLKLSKYLFKIRNKNKIRKKFLCKKFNIKEPYLEKIEKGLEIVGDNTLVNYIKYFKLNEKIVLNLYQQDIFNIELESYKDIYDSLFIIKGAKIDTTIHIGNFIKKLRVVNGIQAKELAEYLKVHPSCITLWEKGNTKPNMKNVKKLILYFKLNYWQSNTLILLVAIAKSKSRVENIQFKILMDNLLTNTHTIKD